MKWFAGSVEEAIQEKTTNKALLLVHVADEGADSLAMDSLWESTEIGDVPTVALRLTAETQSFKQFIQFYPVVALPSAYFIGLDGKVIEAVVGKKEPDELAEFVTRAVGVFKTLLQTAPTQAQVVEPARVPTPVASSPPSPPRNATPPVQEPPPYQEPAPVRPSPPGATAMEQRLQRMREVVQQREEERERADELRRRTGGQEMAKVREEMEAKQREADAAERRKQKESDKVYAEKLRRQIEEDRVEKAARFSAERQREREVQDEKGRLKAQKAAEAAAREQAARASVARLQFRLPDGSSVVRQFEPSDKLRLAHDFARTLLPSRGGILLSTVSPRHVFSPEEFDQTLAELALAPSAVLLVLRSDQGGNSSGNFGQAGEGFFSMLVASFFGFVTTVWAYISGFVFGQPAVAGPAGTQQTEQNQVPDQAQRPKPSPSSSSDSQRPATGKVYRLHDLKRDDDADKATWNGNSTNQM